MKLRLYHRPCCAAGVFVFVVAVLVALASILPTILGTVFLALALLYGFLLITAGVLTGISFSRQGTVRLDQGGTILIVSPHQDDCVLGAGGFGARNRALGGTTHIAYLVQPHDPAIAAMRRDEAERAWRLAGVDANCLHHFSLLPPSGQLFPELLHEAARTIQSLVNAIEPSVVFTPSFEGGHLHHDVTHHIVTRMLALAPTTRIYECPEYSPYFSLLRTPEAALALLVRYAFFGFVAYYPKCEGSGSGRILNLRLSRHEITLKRAMLCAFRSQNGDAMARNHGYADRVIRWRPRPFQSLPFAYRWSRPWLIERLQSVIPGEWPLRLLPGESHTIGLAHGITDLSIYHADAS